MGSSPNAGRWRHVDEFSNYFRLDGKRALIVGAAQGIGKSCAAVFESLGASLCLADLDAHRVDEVRADLRRPNDHCAFAVDVSDEASIDQLVAQAIKQLGHLDIAVCTAGVLFPAPFLEQTAAEWDRTFAVNARGAFLVAQRSARQMVERGQGGRIILYSSIVGTSVVRRNNVAYCASKAAVAQAVRAMALELGPHGITVNAVSPGSTETEMLVSTNPPATSRASSAETRNNGVSAFRSEGSRNQKTRLWRPRISPQMRLATSQGRSLQSTEVRTRSERFRPKTTQIADTWA